ncbi:MAG TPA: aromatic amino acid lyase, partial [Pseudothermotoga sp.]
MIIGEFITIQDVVKVARYFEQVSLSPKSIEKMQKSRQIIEQILQSEKTVYGVNTGFGALATTRISKDDLIKIQHNILLSHACGVGEPFNEEVVRAMMLIRANSLALGFSGVRPIVVEKICELLNKRITPFIPAKGSVGASGDLSPLAHMALVITGEGYVMENGVKVPSDKVLKERSVEPIHLVEKEGLSLVNGTQAMSANLCIAINDALNLIHLATQIASLSADVLFASSDAYEDIVWLARPHEGQKIIAKLMKKLLEDSQIRESHRNCSRVQDAYSLRCVPQVYGAVLDTINYVKNIVQTEINSATDNPLVFDDRVISQGNFHGEPLAFAADFLSIALADLGNMIERRIDRLLNPKVNEGLPPFLAQRGGL